MKTNYSSSRFIPLKVNIYMANILTYKRPCLLYNMEDFTKYQQEFYSKCVTGITRIMRSLGFQLSKFVHNF